MGEGITSLFATNEEWRLIRIKETDNIDVLNYAIQTEAPKAVIIYSGNHRNNTKLPQQLIQQYPELRIIVVSLENNAIEVYNRRTVDVKKVSDLLSIIDD